MSGVVIIQKTRKNLLSFTILFVMYSMNGGIIFLFIELKVKFTLLEIKKIGRLVV